MLCRKGTLFFLAVLLLDSCILSSAVSSPTTHLHAKKETNGNAVNAEASQTFDIANDLGKQKGVSLKKRIADTNRNINLGKRENENNAIDSKIQKRSHQKILRNKVSIVNKAVEIGREETTSHPISTAIKYDEFKRLQRLYQDIETAETLDAISKERGVLFEKLRRDILQGMSHLSEDDDGDEDDSDEDDSDAVPSDQLKSNTQRMENNIKNVQLKVHPTKQIPKLVQSAGASKISNIHKVGQIRQQQFLYNRPIYPRRLNVPNNHQIDMTSHHSRNKLLTNAIYPYIVHGGQTNVGNSRVNALNGNYLHNVRQVYHNVGSSNAMQPHFVPMQLERYQTFGLGKIHEIRSMRHLYGSTIGKYWFNPGTDLGLYHKKYAPTFKGRYDLTSTYMRGTSRYPLQIVDNWNINNRIGDHKRIWNYQKPFSVRLYRYNEHLYSLYNALSPGQLYGMKLQNQGGISYVPYHVYNTDDDDCEEDVLQQQYSPYSQHRLQIPNSLSYQYVWPYRFRKYDF